MSDYLPPPPVASPSGWSSVGPYASAPASSPPMRSLAGLARVLLVLFALTAVVQVAASRARLHRASLVNALADGDTSLLRTNDLVDADDVVRTVEAIHGLLFLVVAVVFITWQLRHAKNADALGSGGRGVLGPGWAIGGWFVPVANWVLPIVQINQSSRASDVEARRAGRPGGVTPIVVAWGIALGIGSMMMLSAGSQAPLDEQGGLGVDNLDDVRSFASADRTAGFSHLALMLAAVLAIFMVHQLSRRQAAAFASVAADPGALAPSPPPSGTSWPMTPTVPAWSPPPPPGPLSPPPPPPGGAPQAPPPGGPTAVPPPPPGPAAPQ